MVEKVIRFVAFDGRDFIHEESALRYEAVERMIAAVPELVLIRGKLETNLNQIAAAVEPLARFKGKTTPEPDPETTPDFGELAGTCDCSASMSGNGPPHHPSCPSYTPEQVVDLADRLAGRA